MTVNDRQEPVAPVDTIEISLDTLPFWPWLWADPFYGRNGDAERTRELAEKRLRVSYETARAPIPNQYALVHRADIGTLMHELWTLRARDGLRKAAEAKLSEALDALETFAIMANAVTAHLPDEHVVLLTYDDSALDADLGGPNTLLGERFMRAFRTAAKLVSAR